MQYVLRLYNRKDWYHMWLKDPDTGKKIFLYPDLPGTNAGFVNVSGYIQMHTCFCCLAENDRVGRDCGSAVL